MIPAPHSVSASAPVPIGASAEVCLPLVVYVPRVPNQPLRSPIFHLGSSSPTFQRASSSLVFPTVSCKKTFKTQRLVSAPFNEFYRKYSGPTIPLPTPFFRRSTPDRIRFINGRSGDFPEGPAMEGNVLLSGPSRPQASWLNSSGICSVARLFLCYRPGFRRIEGVDLTIFFAGSRGLQ
jgi:hypothetical protein